MDLTQQLKTQFLDKHYFFEFNKQVWTHGKKIAQFLEYVDPASAVSVIVESDDKCMFSQFPENIRIDVARNVLVSKQQHVPIMQPSTIFITSTGMLDLFLKSKLPLACKMKRWLINEVIPSILSTGSYSLLVQQSTVVQSLACPRTTTCHNPHGFSISSMKSAIYVLNLPLLNMHKFGYSNNLMNRFKQHEYDFGEIIIELVIETPEVQEIEKRLKLEIRSHGINTVFDINGRKMKELFEPQYLSQVCEIVRDIVTNFQQDSFCNTQNHEYRMECEKTKQEQEKTEQKKCEIEILRLRIELEKISQKQKADEMM